MSTWDAYVLVVGIFINTICAVFYPFSNQDLDAIGFHWNMLLWALFLAVGALTFFLPRLPLAAKSLAVTFILRLIFSAGPELTIYFLGTIIVILKGIHLAAFAAFMGRKTINKSISQIVLDATLLYHIVYLLVCIR